MKFTSESDQALSILDEINRTEAQSEIGDHDAMSTTSSAMSDERQRPDSSGADDQSLHYTMVSASPCC
jgi:hypothetical protein